jgi:hypothetical protein
MEDVTELSHQFGVSVAVVHILEWLKNSRLAPFFSQRTTVLIRLVALVIAALTSVGFKFAVSQGDLSTGGVLTVAFPSLASIVDVLLHTAAQYGAQKGYYHLAIKQPALLSPELPDMPVDHELLLPRRISEASPESKRP